MVKFDMCVLCSDVDYKETLPVRSFTHLALLLLLPPTSPHLSKIGGYDHGSKPLSVCWALVTLGHVYPHWQNLQRNVYMMGRGNWNISSEKRITVSSNSKKGSSLDFFVTIIDKEKCVVLSTSPVVINHQETNLLIGSQSFVITAVYYLRLL